MSLRLLKTALWAGGLAASLSYGSAFAAPCTGVNIGTSDTSDVTFAGSASDQCVIANNNAQSGPNGDTSGFDTEFGGGWSLLGKLPPDSGSATLDGVNFDWTFTQTTGTTGTWTLMADQNVTLDLVFAMHAGGYTGAFLFDDQGLIANAVTPGTWEINWVNNGGQNPDFSNLTLFARDIVATPGPEPETYALMLAGLGAIGFMSKRRRRA